MRQLSHEEAVVLLAQVGACSLDEELGLLVGLLVGGGASEAVGVDAKVVLVHGHVEEAVVTPVGSPRVAADPVLLTSLWVLAVASDRDLVVDEREADLLGVDVGAIVVVLEVLGGVDTARDGAVSVELSLHLVDAGKRVVLADVVLLVLDGDAAIEASLANRGRRPGAVTADVNVLAHVVDEVVSGVLLARRVRDTSVVGIPVHLSGVATIAGATSLAVHDGLGIEADRGGVEVTVQDVESVGDGRGGALSPAGTAVLWDVLVLVPGQVVLAVHVSPVDNLGKVSGVVDLPWVRRVGELLVATLKLGPLNTAATSGDGLVDGGIVAAVLGLRELVDGVVVVGVVPLLIRGDMPRLLSPGVLRSGPGAVALDGDVVGATADAEETILTPVLTPGVADEPVLLAILLTVTNDGDVVDDVEVASVITVDATSVFLEGVGDGNTASNGTSLVDLLHHSLLARDHAVLLNTVHKVLVGDEAGLARVAVAAHVHGGADLTVVETTGTIDGASLISDLVVGHPGEGVVGLTTVATQVSRLARDDDLWGDVDVGPGCLTGDLYTIGDGRGGGMGPAGSAVLWDVLVADVGDHVDTVDVVPEPLGGQVVDGLERLVDAWGNSVEAAAAAGGLWVDLAETESGDAQESDDSEGFHLHFLLLVERIIIKYGR